MKYNYNLKRLPKNTIEITLDIPWKTIEEEYEKVFDVLRKDLVVEGFRKGKVPKDIAKKHLSEAKVYEEVVKTILPVIYNEIIKKEIVLPVIQPQISVVDTSKNKPWKFKISLAEKPTVELGEYKEKVKKLKKELNSPKIWKPGDSEKPTQEQHKKQNEVLNKILDLLLKESKIEISDLIIKSELDRKLAALVDDVKKAGLTMDSYLKAKNTTIDKIKEAYRKEIENMYKIEYIIMEVAEKENIKVGDKDLEALFKNIKDEKQRQSAKANSYYYASILRKQKTLDFLLGL